jgi:putative transposase
LSERVRFMVEWQRRFDATQGGRIDVAELSRTFGISRQTAYVWIRRYERAGLNLRAMDERSRRPKSNPRAVTLEAEDIVVQARKQFPKWGPVKLRAWLVERRPTQSFPSSSCMAAILRRRGMTVPKRRGRRKGHIAVTPPFPECTKSNDTWCMDFKGWFRTRDRDKCHPFTLIDSFSRFLLRCEGLLEPNGNEVRSILDSAFREYGLPRALRSDGGPPFFSPGAPAGLSSLSVWLLRLGLIVECIAPAKPQQNGRLERFHRTLKLCVDPAAHITAQQRAFDAFRREYNHERPHAALALETPGRIYRRSLTRYPRPLLGIDSDGLAGHIELVDRRGAIAWRRHRIFIGQAFSGQRLVLWPVQGTRCEVYFGSIQLGFFDGAAPERGFSPLLRARKTTLRLAYSGDLA